MGADKEKQRRQIMRKMRYVTWLFTPSQPRKQKRTKKEDEKGRRKLMQQNKTKRKKKERLKAYKEQEMGEKEQRGRGWTKIQRGSK